MRTPSVSIIIPTFNRATLLPRALDSVIAQTVSDWEIVVIDDGSTDDTSAVLGRYRARLGDRLICVRQYNRGCSAARNVGLSVARGRFAAFLDSDDEYRPVKLERQLALFDLRPDLALVFSDMDCVDTEGRSSEPLFQMVARSISCVATETVGPNLNVCTGDLFDVLIRGYFIPTIVGMVRRDVAGRDARFPEQHAYAEEWLYYLRVARSRRVGFVNERLCIHHHTAGSLARSDKRRNVQRYYQILRAIERDFADLTSSQRKSVRAQLADACRQLAYDAMRCGARGLSVLRFARAFVHQPRWRILRETVGATVGCVARLGPGRSKERSATCDVATAVR